MDVYTTHGVPVRLIVDNAYINEVDDLATAGIPVIDDAFTSPTYKGTNILHPKFAIINARDDANTADDAVWVGSANWSTSGFTKNDETILFIYDAGLANLYLQEIAVRFNESGGTFPPPYPSIIYDWALYAH